MGRLRTKDRWQQVMKDLHEAGVKDKDIIALNIFRKQNNHNRYK
jgi:uncharacterized protein YggE